MLPFILCRFLGCLHTLVICSSCCNVY